MTEPTVQVPVSLIRKVRAALHVEPLAWNTRQDIYRSLDALLSQPTSTAEPMCECGHAMNQHTQSSGCTAGWTAESYGCRCGAVPGQQAPTPKPPRIEDMAPGTTFTEEVRWTVTGTLSTGVTVAHSDRGEMRFADRFNPSTIRNVTPPKDAA